MGRRFLLVKKLGKTYKRFSVRYAIPLFIATLSWNSFRGHVRNQWYIGNNEGVQLNMEENYKRTNRIGNDLYDFERNFKEYVINHECEYHMPKDHKCSILAPIPNFIMPEEEVILTPNWIIWIQRTLFGLPIEYNSY